MGFRFRKSVKIIPGVRLNLSTGGASVSVGGNGMTANISKRGVKTTVGIPGTGLSYAAQPVKYSHSPQPALPPTYQPANNDDVGEIMITVIALFAMLIALTTKSYIIASIAGIFFVMGAIALLQKASYIIPTLIAVSLLGYQCTLDPKKQMPVTAPVAVAIAAPPTCDLSGKVVAIADGDTITVLDTKKTQYKIRLAGIDAPEKSQPYGNAAKKYLSEMVASREVCIIGNKKDKYSRTVGKVMLDGSDTNYKMVQSGLAWHYKQYQSEQSPSDRDLYSKAEIEARSKTIGLWSEPDPINPSEWRKGTRPTVAKETPAPATAQQLVAPEPATAIATGFSCGGKRFCKQMTSCAEACFHLTQCGIGRLDGDHDGVPCESLCGGGC